MMNVLAPTATQLEKRVLKVYSSSRYSRPAIVGVLGVAAGVAAFWLIGPVADLVSSAWDAAVYGLGLGVIVAIIWLGLFALTLAARRPWFGRTGLWLGSVAWVALILGFLALFQPNQGVLAHFTQQGEVSLGGRAGQAIIGPVTWQAGLRLLGIFVVGMALVATPRALGAFFSSWHGRAAQIVVPGVAAAAAAYWLTTSADNLYPPIRDGVIYAVGLGVTFIGAWVAVALWSLATRRAWHRRARFWLGSASLFAVSLGIMGFFQPLNGALAEFTRHGDVSLGGVVGPAVAGTVPWLGALRLAAICIAALALTSPPLAGGMAVKLRELVVNGYLLLLSSARWIARMYRWERAPGLRSRGRSKTDRPASPVVTPEDSRRFTATRAVEKAGTVTVGSVVGSEPAVGEMSTSFPTLVSVDPVQTARDVNGESDGENDEGWVPVIEEKVLDPVARTPFDEITVPTIEGAIVDAVDLPPVHQAADSPLLASRKFNKFWTSYESKRDDMPEEPGAVAVQNGRSEGDVDEEKYGGDNDSATMSEDREWSKPSTDLLVDAPEGGVTEEEMNETAETIRRTLGQYGVEVEIGQVSPGPTVTMYGLIPGWVRRHKQVKEMDDKGQVVLDSSGKPLLRRVESKMRVKVDSILSREKDLALALKTPSIRIETPAMGQSLVGIEVPNPNPILVTLRAVMESPEFERLRAECQLPIALGKTSGGDPVVTDLSKMPHLLIAGATGSGKSACLNAIISCLVMEKSPEDLRLLLIDPKRVELTPYNGVPHLITPVAVDTDKVVGLLKGVIGEMLDRYRRMEEVSVRNIQSYNAKKSDKMPYLVVVIDELADLMMSAAFDVEQSLCRLAQLGRATGIHLIVATQRPSVDVVTGLIKANFPSRISFGVTSQVDSRTILDTAGADKLLGRGDMLYLPLDASKPMRAQGVFISDREIESLVNYWQTTPWASLRRVILRAAERDHGEKEEDDPKDQLQDELLDHAIELARSYNKVSTSLLQRRLRIGYPRAARLMDQLEEQGVVGPSDGSKSRDVIMSGT